MNTTREENASSQPIFQIVKRQARRQIPIDSRALIGVSGELTSSPDSQLCRLQSLILISSKLLDKLGVDVRSKPQNE